MVLNRDEARALLPVLQISIGDLKTWVDGAEDDADKRHRHMLADDRIALLEAVVVKCKKFLKVEE